MKPLLLITLLLCGWYNTLFPQCVIDSTIQTPGFHPDTGSYLPKACTGSQYNAVVQIYAPQSVTISLGNFPVNYVQLDSIPALPGNLVYSTNPVGGKMNGGERGCINIYGLVNVPPGDYHFTIYYTANFTAFSSPVSLGFTAPYKLHVDSGSAVFYSLSDTVCQYPGYNLGGNWITASGTYTDTLMASSGCDSVVTLQLSVIPFGLEVTMQGNALHAQPGMESYQWYDCSTQAPLTDKTDSVFIPAAPGSYSVMVSNGECSGTSSCFLFTGITDFARSHFKIYPNPSNGRFQVMLPLATQRAELYVVNSMGSVVHRQLLTSTNTQIVSVLSSGVYVVQIVTETTTYIGKLLIK
ncbi:MAG: T9SS type A sorting domain-containing protein [Chitinophagales bacterium]|nr:T9SS type A sorting domain-containing protein [Chitinophagales bacterium]